MFFKGIKNLMVVFLFVFLLCHQTCLTVICEENSAQVYPHLIFQNGYYGYVNDSGKIIIPCQWEDAGEFRGRGYGLFLTVGLSLLTVVHFLLTLNILLQLLQMDQLY